MKLRRKLSQECQSCAEIADCEQSSKKLDPSTFSEQLEQGALALVGAPSDQVSSAGATGLRKTNVAMDTASEHVAAFVLSSQIVTV
jgi:hypothetical protein